MQIVKNWMLPLAMLAGALFHSYLDKLSFLTPVLIFCMLFLTFCKISPRHLRFTHLYIWLLGIQILGGILVYGVFVFLNREVAEGLMICVLAPTATAAAVVTGMLGGSVAFVAGFTFLGNIAVALIAPVLFSLLGNNRDLPFWESFGFIAGQLVPMLVLPLLGAWGVKSLFPRLHSWLLSVQIAAFYMWSLGLSIVTARTVTFLLEQKDPHYVAEIAMAVCSLGICFLQFGLGRRLGKGYGETVSAGQGLGQKNTILAIWMAQVYLSPAASVGPAAYVLWQNLLNSWQLWKKNRKE